MMERQVSNRMGMIGGYGEQDGGQTFYDFVKIAWNEFQFA
jgi:hypothetical protein